MPVMSMAAANIPATGAYCGDTVCGAYIIPSELKLNIEINHNTIKKKAQSHSTQNIPKIA